MVNFIFSLLLVTPLVFHSSASPARIPNTVPKPPPIPPLRLRRDLETIVPEAEVPESSLLRMERSVKYPQPSRPQPPRPVPFPKPVQRPRPIPPLRIRRDVEVPQTKLVQDLHLPEHNPVSIKVITPEKPHVPRPLTLPREDENHEPHLPHTSNTHPEPEVLIPAPEHVLRTPNPPLRMARSAKFPQPQKPQRPRPVPLPKPVPRPRPIPPLRIRRDVVVPQPHPAKSSPRKPDIPRPLTWPKEDQNQPASSKRLRRFVEGENKFLNPSKSNSNPTGWEVNPNLSRDQRGNTKGSVDVTHHTENGEIHGSWGQNLRGPDKHSETWSIGGKFNWP